MRSVATALATVATAGVITVFLPASAMAANGTMNVDGQTYQNPSGCFNASRWPMVVMNNTDGQAVILQGPDCQGNVDTVVYPNQSRVSEYGRSVYIY